MSIGQERASITPSMQAVVRRDKNINNTLNDTCDACGKLQVSRTLHFGNPARRLLMA
jgi:hypothetical protein